MIETVLGSKIAIFITLIYIVHILTLNCVIVKWLNGDIIDHLFHFIHDNHDHKFDNANSSSLVALHNSENLNLTDTLDIIKIELTDSKLNLNEFFLNIFAYLSILLILLCKINKMKSAPGHSIILKGDLPKQSANEPKVIFNNFIAEEKNDNDNANVERLKIEIKNIEHSRSNNVETKFTHIIFTAIVYITLFLVIYLSLSFNSIQLTVKCERFFKNGFHMVSYNLN